MLKFLRVDHIDISGRYVDTIEKHRYVRICWYWKKRDWQDYVYIFWFSNPIFALWLENIVLRCLYPSNWLLLSRPIACFKYRIIEKLGASFSKMTIFDQDNNSILIFYEILVVNYW